jgi:hypothetical protein
MPIEEVGAPTPILRMRDQVAFDGIEMYVIQLFVLLSRAPDIEVVKAALPEARVSCSRGFVPKAELAGRGALAAALSQSAGHALFEDLDDNGRVADARFADEKVDVFGHDDAAEEGEIVVIADVVENAKESVASCGCVEKGQTAITTESDEVEVAEAVAALELFRHRFSGTAERRGRKAPRSHTEHGAPAKAYSAVTFRDGIMPATFVMPANWQNGGSMGQLPLTSADRGEFSRRVRPSRVRSPGNDCWRK